MLHLLEPTDPRWVEVVAQDLPGLLADHAHCELKAAQSALAIVGRFGADAPELVDPLTALAHAKRRSTFAKCTSTSSRAARRSENPRSTST
jgi:tRNA-(ms[2]io[6]A)-hydroxylase